MSKDKTKPLSKLRAFELGLIAVIIAIFSVNIYLSLVEVTSIGKKFESKFQQLEVTFSKPISRLIVSVHTSPPSEMQIDWENPLFKNSLFTEMIIEADSNLLPNQEYLVEVKGLRTLDRLFEIPLSFRAKTDFDKTIFTEIKEEQGETYGSPKDYPDFIQRININ